MKPDEERTEKTPDEEELERVVKRMLETPPKPNKSAKSSGKEPHARKPPPSPYGRAEPH